MSRTDPEARARVRQDAPDLLDRLRPVAVVFLLGLLPWTVLRWADGYGLVFAFGLVNPDPPTLVTVTEYLFELSGGPAGLPRRLVAWPVGVLLWALAALSALGGAALGREDRRVTGWLLVLAGVGHLGFAAGLIRPGLLAVPVGTALLWATAWWGYGGDLLRVAGR